GELRLLIVLGVTVGWLWALSRWLIGRFGRPVLIGIIASVVTACSLIGWAYWLEAPNRHLGSQIEQIPGCYTGNNRPLFPGKVDYVYIGSTATEQDIVRFTELEGLHDLATLILNRSHLAEATARKLVRLKSLKYLDFRNTEVSEDVVEELRRELPKCTIRI